MEALEKVGPETPGHILEISEMIIRYARGDISFEEYRNHLDSWYEKNREAWKESDLATLFLACCLSE
jgi:hypothetical protein